jgi:hypothetical protein
VKESLKLFSPQTFKKSLSSSSIKRRSIEKERKRSTRKEKGRKAPKVSHLKKGNSIF